MKKLWWCIKCIIGFGTVTDDSICWFSKKFFNIHDYHLHRGGDGVPTPFYEYKCSKCKQKYNI